MVIESHAHYTNAPAALDAFRGRQITYYNRPETSGSLVIPDDDIRSTIAKHIRHMDDHSVAASLFSPRGSGAGHEFGTAETSRIWIGVNNDLIRRVHELFPRLIPVAQLPQSPGVGLQASAEELRRRVLDEGFVGCIINPDVAGGGQPFTPRLGDPWWNPLWDAMTELDVPGLIHASSTHNPAVHLNGSHYVNVDLAAAFELCYSDLFDRYPTLKLIVPHGGGGLPFYYGRFHALHISAGIDDFERRVRRIFYDTAVYDRAATEMLIDRVGPANVLYASEPFGTAKATDPSTGRPFDDVLDHVTSTPGLSPDEIGMILDGNARKLYVRAAFPRVEGKS
ncbi:MAG: amidohydrolase family protein [Protaetiibacter sp.]